MTLRTERIDAFRDDICAVCGATPGEETIQIDANLRLEDAVRVWPEVVRLEPFGNGNPTPVFATRVQAESAPVSVNPWIAKVRVRQDGRAFEVKHFAGKVDTRRIDPGSQIDMAFILQPDPWKREGFSVVLEAARLAH